MGYRSFFLSDVLLLRPGTVVIKRLSAGAVGPGRIRIAVLAPSRCEPN